MSHGVPASITSSFMHGSSRSYFYSCCLKWRKYTFRQAPAASAMSDDRRRGIVQVGTAQILVDRLPADPVDAGKNGFRNAVVGALDQQGLPVRRKGLLSTFAGRPRFYAFPLHSPMMEGQIRRHQ